MNIVILAGGLGSRLSEITKTIPKPMVKINGKPILVRIMKHFAKYGFKNFYIALGYKGKVIKKYFAKNNFGWNINLINTGKKTMTGGRLRRLTKYLKNETFLMTYGDGLSDVNLNKLLKFHRKNKKLVTLTAVRPPARFGNLKIQGNNVEYFREKLNTDEGWINGGFFVMEDKIFKYIKDKKTILEQYPLEKLSKLGKLGAYKHNGFWQCVDTLRDKELLEEAIRKKQI